MLHVAPGAGNFVRSNNRMQSVDLSLKGSGMSLDPKFSLLFGNSQAYTFFRLYCLLVEILDDSKRRLEAYDQPIVQVESMSQGKFGPGNSKEARCDYVSVVVSLQKVLNGEMTALDFERRCRLALTEGVAQMAVLPKLVEKCADVLCKLAKDQTIFTLQDYAMTKESDPVKLRSYSLMVSEYSCYRIQYDRVSGWMYFSYLDPEQALLEVPEFDDDDEEELDEEQEVDATEDDHEEHMGEENEGELDDEGEESDDADDGDVIPPDSKRAKLE